MVVSVVVVGFRNISITIFVDFQIRSRSKKFICPLFSYVGLNFVSLCVWFIFMVIRSACILLELYTYIKHLLDTKK
jgi:hypothetical protein